MFYFTRHVNIRNLLSTSTDSMCIFINNLHAFVSVDDDLYKAKRCKYSRYVQCATWRGLLYVYFIQMKQLRGHSFLWVGGRRWFQGGIRKFSSLKGAIRKIEGEGGHAAICTG